MNYNFVTPIIAAALLCTAPGLLHAQSEGETVIGTFTGTLDDSPIELLSIHFAEDDYSDLAIDEAGGANIYSVFASVDGDMPALDIALQEGGVGGDLKIVSITFMDDGYDTALSATQETAAGVALESYGAINVEELVLGADGAISFSFAADLVRIDLESEDAIEGEPGARLEGEYSGTFPTTE